MRECHLRYFAKFQRGYNSQPFYVNAGVRRPFKIANATYLYWRFSGQMGLFTFQWRRPPVLFLGLPPEIWTRFDLYVRSIGDHLPIQLVPACLSNSFLLNIFSPKADSFFALFLSSFSHAHGLFFPKWNASWASPTSIMHTICPIWHYSWYHSSHRRMTKVLLVKYILLDGEERRTVLVLKPCLFQECWVWDTPIHRYEDKRRNGKG